MPTGVPFNPKKDDVIDALRIKGGNLTLAAELLKCHRATLHDYINENPDVKQELEKYRYHADEILIDMAEDTLGYAIAMRKKDLGNALKSVMYTLNNKGQSRGYAHPHKTDRKVEEMIDKIDDNINSAHSKMNSSDEVE